MDDALHTREEGAYATAALKHPVARADVGADGVLDVQVPHSRVIQVLPTCLCDGSCERERVWLCALCVCVPAIW